MVHDAVTTFAVLFYTFNKFLNGWEDKKIKYVRLLKLEVAVGSEVYGVVKLYCTCLILQCVGDCVVFCNSINEK